MFKKGEVSLLWFIIIDLILIVMMSSAAFIFVESKLNDDSFWKNYYAKDTAMLLDSMVAEGDIKTDYEIMQGSKLFEFDFLTGIVKTTIYTDDVPKENRLPAIKSWAKPESIDFEEKTLIPVTFFFEKSQNNLAVKEKGLAMISCPYVNTKANFFDKTIYVELDDSNVPAELNVQQILQSLTSRLKTASRYQADISLKLSFSSQEENILKIYYSNNNLLENQKLGCLVANNFIRYFPEYFSEIILEPGYAADSELGLDIEMGSIKSLDEEAQKEIINFANSIYGGIYAYYE